MSALTSKLAYRLLALGLFLGLLLSSGCYRQSLDRESSHGLTNDPYPVEPKQHADTLRILVWSDNNLGILQKDFKERYGINVITDTFVSDDEAYQMLKANPGKWDLLLLSQYMGERMRLEGLLQTIPRQNEQFYRYIDPSIINAKADPQLKYFIPYDYSTLGISFNIDYLSGFPRDWSYVVKQTDNSYIYGRVALPDDRRYALAAVMLLAGLDPDKPTRESIEKAKNIIIRNINELGVRFVPFDKIKEEMLTRNTLLAVTWSGTAADILKTNPACRFLLPEGSSIISVDGFVVPKGSRNPETAALMIEYLLHPYVSMVMANETMYASVNMRSMKFVDRFIINGPSCMLPPPEKLVHMRPLNAEEQKLFDEAWAEIKATSINTSKVKLLPLN